MNYSYSYSMNVDPVVFQIVFGITFVIMIITLVGMAKVFTKAGQPGWAVIVPFYNIYIMTVIAEKESWWVFMFFIPIVNFFFAIMLFLAIAEKFNKSAGFAVGLIFLGMIFWPILGFGDAKYLGSNDDLESDLLDDF